MSFWGHPHRRFPPVSGFTLITRVSISASSVTTPSHHELEIIIHSLKGFVTQTVCTKEIQLHHDWIRKIRQLRKRHQHHQHDPESIAHVWLGWIPNYDWRRRWSSAPKRSNSPDKARNFRKKVKIFRAAQKDCAAASYICSRNWKHSSLKTHMWLPKQRSSSRYPGPAATTSCRKQDESLHKLRHMFL